MHVHDPQMRLIVEDVATCSPDVSTSSPCTCQEGKRERERAMGEINYICCSSGKSYELLFISLTFRTPSLTDLVEGKARGRREIAALLSLPSPLSCFLPSLSIPRWHEINKSKDGGGRPTARGEAAIKRATKRLCFRDMGRKRRTELVARGRRRGVYGREGTWEREREGRRGGPV